MIPSTLEKTLTDTVIDVLKANLGFSYFKRYFYGDPYDIPTSALPCVTVELIRTQINAGPTGMDEVIQTMQIKLFYNKKDDITLAPTSEVTGVRALESMVQGIDPTSSEYEQHTIVGILRKNFTLGNLATNQTMDVRYGLSPRPAALLAECMITFVVEEFKSVTART